MQKDSISSRFDFDLMVLENDILKVIAEFELKYVGSFRGDIELSNFQMDTYAGNTVGVTMGRFKTDAEAS